MAVILTTAGRQQEIPDVSLSLYGFEEVTIPPETQTSTNREVSTPSTLGYRLNGRRTRVRFQAGASYFSFHPSVQTGSGAHLTSYRMCIGACFSWGLSGLDVKLTTHLHAVTRC
jgi:hypothetical protein